MIIGILKETQKGEKRVSIAPRIAKQLIDKGFDLIVEENACEYSSFQNYYYKKAGARIE